MAAQLLEDAAFTIRIELPGDVEGHNADAVDGGALVWSLDLLCSAINGSAFCLT